MSAKPRAASNAAATGEYACVLRQSGNPGLLALAHQTPCDRTTVARIVSIAQEMAPGQPPALSFRAGSPGRANHRTNRVTLPSERLVRGERPAGRLRVGIVAHEMAHIVCGRRGHPRGHGAQFCAALDEILSRWRTGL